VPLNPVLATLLQPDTQGNIAEENINALALRLCSLPEYQLC
jgi:hypothetical protein